jgi:hypothetical protein
MPGRRTNKNKNYGAHKAFKEHQRTGRASDVIARTSQEMYRRACLNERMAEGRLTEKNKDEMRRLVPKRIADIVNRVSLETGV